MGGGGGKSLNCQTPSNAIEMNPKRCKQVPGIAGGSRVGRQWIRSMDSLKTIGLIKCKLPSVLGISLSKTGD